MQKMLIINVEHSYDNVFNDGLDDLNDYLSKGWKVVNMQESGALNRDGYVLHICYVVIEKEGKQK